MGMMTGMSKTSINENSFGGGGGFTNRHQCEMKYSWFSTEMKILTMYKYH